MITIWYKIFKGQNFHGFHDYYFLSMNVFLQIVCRTMVATTKLFFTNATEAIYSVTTNVLLLEYFVLYGNLKGKTAQ